jgi:hypothetical protein
MERQSRNENPYVAPATAPSGSSPVRWDRFLSAGIMSVVVGLLVLAVSLRPASLLRRLVGWDLLLRLQGIGSLALAGGVITILVVSAARAISSMTRPKVVRDVCEVPEEVNAGMPTEAITGGNDTGECSAKARGS